MPRRRRRDARWRAQPAWRVRRPRASRRDPSSSRSPRREPRVSSRSSSVRGRLRVGHPVSVVDALRPPSSLRRGPVAAKMVGRHPGNARFRIREHSRPSMAETTAPWERRWSRSRSSAAVVCAGPAAAHRVDPHAQLGVRPRARHRHPGDGGMGSQDRRGPRTPVDRAWVAGATGRTPRWVVSERSRGRQLLRCGVPRGGAHASSPAGWRERLVGATAVALATLIALSRVYLGAHFPSDVVAGAVAGNAGRRCGGGPPFVTRARAGSLFADARAAVWTASPYVLL